MEGVFPLVRVGNVDLSEVVKNATLKGTYTYIWTVYKIFHFFHANLAHMTDFVSFRLLRIEIPEPIRFDRGRAAAFSSEVLGVAGMSSCFVTTWGLVKGIDALGQVIIRGSSTEVHTSTNLDVLVREFQDLGGVINHAADFDLARGRIRGTFEPVKLDEAPLLATGCEFGRNRSRLTARVALAQGYQQGKMFQPHGGTTGYDVLHSFDHHEWVTALASAKSFFSGYRRPKYLRQNGVDETAGMNREERREWMDREYFGKMIGGKGVVVIAFDHCFHAMLLRLVSLAKNKGVSLKDVRIVPVCAEDPQYVGIGNLERAFQRCVRQLFSCNEAVEAI